MANQQLTKVGNNLAGFKEYLDSKKGAIAAVCAGHMNADRISRVVMNCVTRTPQLRSCTTVSIFRSVMQAAELGLEPGSALGEAYLVPYKDTCQLIPGYRGLVTLARRSGEISNVWAEVAYEGDRFEATYGLNPDIVHVPAFATQDPNKILFAYACARFRTGETQFVVMPRIEIERIRNRAASKGGPWSTDYAEMAKKTAVKRLCKMLPMSVELARAVKLDNASESGDFTDVEFDAVDALPDQEEASERSEQTEQTAQPARGTEAVKDRLKRQAAASEEPELTPEQRWERMYNASGLPQERHERAKHESELIGRQIGPEKPPTPDEHQTCINNFGAYLDWRQSQTTTPPEEPTQEPAPESAPASAPPSTPAGMFDEIPRTSGSGAFD